MTDTWSDLREGAIRKFCFVEIDLVAHSAIAANNSTRDAEATFSAFLNYIEEKANAHGGQAWSLAGDGGLFAFYDDDVTTMAEQATSAALDIVDHLDEFNATKSRVKQQVGVRIAVHLGDARYFKQTGHIQSDDINFVAHLEKGATKPDSVSISANVYREIVQNEMRLRFHDNGMFEGRSVYTSIPGNIKDKNIKSFPNRKIELPSFGGGEEARDYAYQHRMENPQLSTSAFKEAARLFEEEGRRKNAMQASSWHLTLRGASGEKGAEYERDLFQFIEKYRDFYNERGYLFCNRKYLMQFGIRSQQNGDYLTTAAVFQELADLVENHGDAFSNVPKEQIVIWRAQAKTAAAKNSNDIKERIRYFQEAADLSLPPEGLDSALANEMKVHRAAYLSEVEKLSAFGCVRRGRNDLDGAITHMNLATEYAQMAKSLDLTKFDLHPHYLSYWLNMFRARRCVEDGDFPEAIRCLKKAAAEAAYFSDSIFPNYFANRNDLVQERLLVDAYIAFSEKQYSYVSTLLSTWLKAMKTDLQGSWKYANVAVRQVLADVLSKGLSPLPANMVKERIEKASGSVRLGTACIKISDLALNIASMAELGLLTNESHAKTVAQCIPLFPLSSQTGYQVSLSFFKQEPYDELPAYFGEWIKEAERLDGKTLFNELELGLRAYLTVICDYYNQKQEALVRQRVRRVKPLPVDFQRDFMDMDVCRLVTAVTSLLKSIGKSPRLVDKFQQWLNDYLQLRNQFLDKGPPEAVKQMLELIREKLIGQTYIEMFPLVVQVICDVGSKDDIREYESKVLWQRPEAETMKLQGRRAFEVGKYYYFKPHWKNFYHGVQDTDHLTFEAYQSLLFEERVINEYQRLRERRYIYHNFKWKYVFEIPSKIQELENIVNNSQREKEIEHFLLKNKWMLSPYYIETEAQKPLQEDYRLDLFCIRYDKGQDIWEIKLPSERLFSADLTKTRVFDAALDQLRGYQHALQDNAPRIFLQTQMRIHNPWGFLLIGRDGEPEHQKRLRLLNDDLSRFQCTVFTYDDLIRRAKSLLETLRG